MHLTEVSPGIIRITAPDANTLQEALNEAAGRLIHYESQRQTTRGVLLVRHNHAIYSAQLTRHVPYGEIREMSL